MRPLLLAGLLLLGALVPAADSQESDASLLGRVRDDEGSPVFAADIRLEREGVVVARAETDRLGFFRFDGLAPAVYRMVATRLGYAETVLERVAVTAGDPEEVEITLPRAAVDVEGLRVEAERSRERARFEEIAGITVREMSAEELKLVPGLAEADPIRAIEVLPGVVSTSDFSSAFHVRGGSADQNLILLDGVPIFSPFHLGGFFSVFNADMVDRAELSSGGFGPEFGGRVSSVLEIRSDAGDGDFGVDAGVSLLASRAAVKGGMDAGTREALGLQSARWRVSARRSYFDLLLKPVFEFPYHLQDFQGVAEAWTKGGDRITLTAYGGRDVLDLTRLDAQDFPLRIDWDWGNDLVGVRWTRPRRTGGSLSVRAGWSRFRTGLLFPDFGDTDFRSAVDQAFLGVDLDHRPAPGWRLKVGGDLQRFGYDNLARSGGTTFGRGEGTGTLAAGYGQVEWGTPGAWLVEAGARLDAWLPDPGEAVFAPSPRISLKRFFGGSSWAVKASAGRYTQFLHSLRDEELPLGLDVWVLAGARAPHVESDQVQAGVEGFLGAADEWQVALEAYWRDFDGVVTLNSADDPNDEVDDILSGDGTSYGADLLVRRLQGDVRGWLALSWLRATRTFPDPLSPVPIAKEVTYPPVFDRRVDMDLVLRFPLGAWDAGVRFNLGTGTPFTRPLGSFAFYQPQYTAGGGRLIWVGEDDDTDDLGGFAVTLGDRNGDRYPVYHRLDLSVRRSFETSWGTVVPHLDVLNVYNRKNVLFYFYEYEKDPPTRSGISMFPVLPTVGVEIRF